MMIWSMGVVLAAVLTNPPLALPRAEEPPAIAGNASTAEVSVRAGEAAYLANVQTVAVRTSGESAAEVSALNASLAIWLPGVAIVSSDDADLIIEWADHDDDTYATHSRDWDRVAFVLDGVASAHSEPAPPVTDARQWPPAPLAHMTPEEADYDAGTPPDALPPASSVDVLSAPEDWPNVHPPDIEVPAPVVSEPAVQWTATLFRIDCQRRNFSESAYRPANGRCEGEIPVFIRTHLAEINGRAHDRDAAVAALAEALRELIVGVPRGVDAAQP